MNFRIEPASPDDILIRVEFHKDTWFDVAKLMERLTTIEEVDYDPTV